MTKSFIYIYTNLVFPTVQQMQIKLITTLKESWKVNNSTFKSYIYELQITNFQTYLTFKVQTLSSLSFRIIKIKKIKSGISDKI